MLRLLILLFMAFSAVPAAAGEDPGQSGAEREAREAAATTPPPATVPQPTEPITTPDDDTSGGVLAGLPGITAQDVPPAQEPAEAPVPDASAEPQDDEATPEVADNVAPPATTEAPTEEPEPALEFVEIGSPEAMAIAQQHYDMGNRDNLNADIDRLTKLIQREELKQKLQQLRGAPSAEQRAQVHASAQAQASVPAPRVVARSSFAGEAEALLRFSNGGELTVTPGDVLPNDGKVVSIDAGGVTVIWNGQRERLFDISHDEKAASSNADSMFLPPAPLDVLE